MYSEPPILEVSLQYWRLRALCASLTFLLFFIFLLVSISACVCRRPSWTPKTKPNGHFSMAGWFRFWCSTRLLMSGKNPPAWRRKRVYWLNWWIFWWRQLWTATYQYSYIWNDFKFVELSECIDEIVYRPDSWNSTTEIYLNQPMDWQFACR